MTEHGDAARLEPLQLGQLFDRSLKLYRHNLRTIFGISGLAFAVGYVAVKPQLAWLKPTLRQVADLALHGAATSVPPELWLEAVGGLLMLFITVTLATTVGEGAVIEAARSLYLDGRVDVRASLRSYLPKIPRLLLTRLMMLAVYLLLGIATMAAVAGALYLAFRYGGGYLIDHGFRINEVVALSAGVTMLVAVLPGAGLIFYLVLCWTLVPSVVVVEGRGYFGALLRSFRLIRRRDPTTRPRKHVTRAAILLMAYTAIYSSLDGVVGVFYWLVGFYFGRGAGGAGGALLYGPAYVPPAAGVPLELLMTFFDAALQPLVWLAMLVLYYDIRVRHEGYDLELLAERLDADRSAAA